LYEELLMALLADVLQANGGLDMWRRLRKFTVHMSIGGALCARKCSATRLKHIVVEGSTREQSVEITGFMAPDRRALYRPACVVLEGSDGEVLKERHATPAQFRDQCKSSTWDELQLAHYCGCLIWNYLTVPFILADTDVNAEALEAMTADANGWRRLKARFPPRIVTHSAEQTFYVDRQALLRRREYVAEHEEQTEIAQLFSGHQSFSGILVPALCRVVQIGIGGTVLAERPLVDIEIFDAVFE
jgi:hypothetical protein